MEVLNRRERMDQGIRSPVGVQRLDPTGELHGLLGELQAGHFIVTVPASEEEPEALADTLRSHGGRFINHPGIWTVTLVEP